MAVDLTMVVVLTMVVDLTWVVEILEEIWISVADLISENIYFHTKNPRINYKFTYLLLKIPDSQGLANFLPMKTRMK